jgi:cytosine deaminase
MLTSRSARLLRRDEYGIAMGKPADIVVFDCRDAQTTVAELAQPLCGFKRGRLTVSRPAGQLHRAWTPLLPLPAIRRKAE